MQIYSNRRPPHNPGKTGLYVHIPFCGRKCPYCDFFSTTDFSLISAFQKALTLEINHRGQRCREVDTIYFGGGTPSAVPVEVITCTLAAIRAGFSVSADCEITVEVNPESVTPEKMAAFKGAGINRVSMGLQSFSDRNLRLLKRPHSAEESRRAYEHVRAAGFTDISLDLIYGLPGQSASGWRRDLETAVGLGPEHLSCYTLTYEPRTVFDQRLKKGLLQPLDEGKVSELFLLTVDFLSGRGYVQYEISSFARFNPLDQQRFVSRHNAKYWTFAPYLGLGPAAHSFTENTRSWNVPSVRRYIKKMKTRGSAMADSEALSRPQQMMEALYLGLRTSDGIHKESFNARFGADFDALFGKPLVFLKKEGLVDLKSGRCLLTRQGMLVLDAVVQKLIMNF